MQVLLIDFVIGLLLYNVQPYLVAVWVLGLLLHLIFGTPWETLPECPVPMKETYRASHRAPHA